MKIALLQIGAGDTLNATSDKGVSFCRGAKKMGSDLALFPEMFSNGYRLHGRPAPEWMKEAIPANHQFVRTFEALSQELSMAIGITLLEAFGAGPKNTLILFDRFGRQILKYSKVHTCDFDAERNLTPGDDFYVSDLDTESGTVKIGAMICFDREFPESARILMLKGAEIILVPNACPMEINRLSQLRARAYENMLGIATCNYPSGVPDCNGHSTAFDGVVYPPDGSGPRDTRILEADESEGIWLADFDLELMRAYRREEVQGNAYRHPRKYKLLCADRIDAPFIRADYRE